MQTMMVIKASVVVEVKQRGWVILQRRVQIRDRRKNTVTTSKKKVTVPVRKSTTNHVTCCSRTTKPSTKRITKK